jgi:MFS family permease
MNESSIRYPGWRVALACFTMTLCGFGFGFYGHSVYFAELTTRGGGAAFAASTVSAAVTTSYLASALMMAFTSDLIARVGPRVFAMTGAAMMGISLFLIARIDSVVGLFVAYLAMAPAFAMLTNAAVFNILGLWFHEKRGLAISLALTGGGIGGVVVVPSLVWLSATLTFPTALQIAAMAAVPVLLLVIAIWISGPARPARADAVGPDEATAGQRQRVTRRSALRSIHYWTVAAPLMLAIMVQVAFVVHQMAILLPVLGLQGAGTAVLLTAAMAAASRIVMGLFVDRLDQRRLGAVLLGMQAMSLFAIMTFGTPLAAYFASAVFGFAVGVMITLPALLIQREFPPGAFGMLSGLTLAIIQTGNALGPTIVGGLRDATGSYAAPVLVCIAMEILAAAVLLGGNHRGPRAPMRRPDRERPG